MLNKILRCLLTVLEQEPTNPHIQLAELRMASSMLGFDTMQHKILKKAATLGADAVVFFQPQSHVEHQTTYEPVYDPWGHYAPFYGSGAWG